MTNGPRVLSLGAAALLALAACGPSGDRLDEAHATLQLDPPASEHLILNGAAVQQAFTAMLVDQHGNQRDVTDEVVFSIDAGIGSFVGNTVTLAGAGKTLAYGVWEDKSGSAQVISRVQTVRVEPPLPATTPDLFAAPEDAARAPNLVYPAADVVIPRNLGDFETHWTDSHGNDVFEVSLRSEFADVRVYVAGGNGVPAAGPRPSWLSFAAAEWASAVGIETTVQYQVRAASTANPTYVGAAAPRLVKLSNEPMDGGIYYWAATDSGGGAYGIFRHDMGKPGQPAEPFMTNQTTGRCVACHALSRDGTKMAITYDGGGGLATIVDVASTTRQPDTQTWNFATFTPDGSRLLSVHAGVIVVRNTADQSVIGTMPAGGYATHPDVSADGTKLAYVRATPGSDWSFTGGTIYTRAYDPVTNAFGAETPLVTTGVNNFYPSWSPDGQWVLFNRSDTGTSYNSLNASLWVVRADGSAPPIQLTAFNQAAGGLTNSWGRWAPFEQTVGENHEPVFWITVSSKRDFGVRRINSLDAENVKTPQIWMAPFFSGRAGAGQDPSTPAFRVPFQNLTSNNHIAQWTERVVLTL